MAIIVVTEDGAIYTLPEALALDDHEISIETPGIDIPRRHGSMRFDRHKAAQPRKLTASGHVYGIDKADAERIGAELRSALAGAGVLKLKRTTDSDHYIYCEARDIRSDYNRGHYGASLLTLSVTFEALDPWWYLAWQGALRVTAASGEVWTYSHAGTDRAQPTVVHITPAEGAGALVNPRLVCTQTGDALQFTGTIEADQVLVADCQAKVAKLYDYADILLESTEAPAETNVWSSMNTTWQVHGLRLLPGDNTLTYTDDEISSHLARVYIEHQPRSW